MKPCRKNRKRIVLLVMDALSSPEAVELTSHLKQCEGCCHYHQEISFVAQRLNSMQSLAAPACEFLAERLTRASAPEARSLPAKRGHRAVKQRPLAAILLSWRVALAGLCAIGLIVLVLAPLVRHEEVLTPTDTLVVTKPVTNQFTDLAPTLANYRAVANESLEKLDDLLARQGKKPVPTPPTFSAMTLALLSLGD
jgi:hypothetical protein